MFRFTIRDVLWLTVVVALGCAWWLNRQSMNSERAAWDKERIAIGNKAKEEQWQLQSKLKKAEKKLSLAKQETEVARDLGRHWQTDFIKLHQIIRWEQTPEAEREESKRQSQALGAPQPLPLPPGYGEKPNE